MSQPTIIRKTLRRCMEILCVCSAFTALTCLFFLLNDQKRWNYNPQFRASIIVCNILIDSKGVWFHNGEFPYRGSIIGFAGDPDLPIVTGAGTEDIYYYRSIRPQDSYLAWRTLCINWLTLYITSTILCALLALILLRKPHQSVSQFQQIEIPTT
ncbi:hypothetical protein [Poriferisphaera sp. WC338]|uniref:hypothetical protein n=1 Tax=Poriferisphaera sp. WC338 TaxID=3425129 RepID=UPI003D81B2BB